MRLPRRSARGLAGMIAWQPQERDFIGRDALEKVGVDKDRQNLVGLLLEDRGILRNQQRVVVDGMGDGEITSGGFSPAMQHSIALARLPAAHYGEVAVEVRNIH